MSTLTVSARSQVRPARLAGAARPARAARAARPVGQAEHARDAVVPGSGTLRLTRRGRLAVLGTALLLVGTGFLAGRTGADADAGTGAGAGAGQVTRQVVVQPGQTLWSIAGQAAPGVDRERTMSRIRQLNDLPGSALQVGQRLAVPAG